MTIDKGRGKFFEENLIKEIRNKFCYIDEDPYNGKRIFFENAGGSLTLKSVKEINNEMISFPDCTSRPNNTSRYLNERVR